MNSTGNNSKNTNSGGGNNAFNQNYTGLNTILKSPNASDLKAKGAFRSPTQTNKLAVDLSNLAQSIGKKNVKGLNFADILDDVTYLADPSVPM